MNPLVHNLAGDTIGDIRSILAVIDAAVSNLDGPDGTPYGVHLLLALVDSALAEAFLSDEADPSPDPECQPLTLALLPAAHARLATVARAWGVLPATLAQTLVTDGLAEIGRREQGGEA